GDGTTNNGNRPRKIGDDTWQSVSAGSFHTMAIRTDGTLWAWGNNEYGRLGDGTANDRHSPEKIGDDTWQSVSAGGEHTVAIRTDGTLWAWGRNSSGQLGDGTTNNGNRPRKIGDDTWQSVSAGWGHTMAIRTDGTLWAWGMNNYGKLGDGTTTNKSWPEKIGDDTWQSVSASGDHTVAIRTDRSLWAWGMNNYGQLGDGTKTNKSWPRKIGDDTWQSVSASWGHTMAIRTDGTLWAWGMNNSGQLGDGTTTSKTSPVKIDTWQSVSAGSFHTMAIRTDGSLWAWGRNNSGQLGDGTTSGRFLPVKIGNNTTWKSVSAGWGHTMAIRTDGTLWAWGNNSSGQLGDGTANDRHSPEKIGDDTWQSVSASGDHTVAIRTDGTLWAWGNNEYGQLGDGTTNNGNRPRKIGDDTWQSVSAGSFHTMAIRTDGTLWAWGRNNSGQLGDGTTTSQTSPVKLDENTWQSVSAGDSHTMAIRTDGTLWAWGSNSSGQLGDGTTTNKSSPVKIGDDTWQSVSSGDSRTMAIRTDGTLWALRNNLLKISEDTWQSVSAGGNHTMAIRTDGTLWAWGNNEYGQLGDVDTSSPILILEPFIVPSANPGVYNEPFQLSLSYFDPNAEIYYTTDGSDPTTDGIRFLNFIDIDRTTTVKAAARIDGVFRSVQTFEYVISPIITESHSSGEYIEPFSLVLTSGIPQYSLFYTTDGSDPRTDGILYTGAIDIHKTTNLKVAAGFGGAWGDVAEFEYTFPDIEITISPTSGTYNEIITVTLSCNIAEYDVYYTIDGGTNVLYTKPLRIDRTATVTAWAESGGYVMGTPKTVNYNLVGIPFVTAAPAPGVYDGAANVTLTSSSPIVFNEIYYTLDGSNPYENGILYNGTINIRETSVLRAVPKASGDRWGVITDVGTYTINPPVSLTGTATISNTNPQIGDTLTASLVGGNNTGTLTYTWKAGTETLGTGINYTILVGDFGKQITLEVTSGIETGTRTSAATAAVLKKTAPSAPSAPTLPRFTQNQYTITAKAGKGGKVAGGKTVNHNATVTLRATANRGYKFAGWFEGKNRVSAKAAFTFKATANRTLQARFKAVKVKSVKLNTARKSLKTGRKFTLRAAVRPANALNRKVTWRSSNKKVASVNSKGRVTARKKGTATITVTTRDGRKTAKCKIKIK
ncbi:MAG: chitobiase/beta-hexosaminidase C-terminal domain-containing protein, partial [Oscillospiraceae bacterium]|nr:chitobiase/beta-hexosaminidase C-terminal domain-containing protein [Oscillospiraceae bacterium]